MGNYLKQIAKLPNRVKQKGFWDTLALLCHLGNGVLCYYFNPFIKKQSKLPHPDCEKIRSNLTAEGLTVIPYRLNVSDFRNWLTKANFPKEYIDSYGEKFVEKALEHYVGAKLLQIAQDDVLIDVAASHSPWYKMVERMYGCQAYALDLVFPSGINAQKIGADATAMPLPDGFASKVALHCAYETFEGNADIKLLPEIERVLSPSGKMVILPLYMHDFFFIESSPVADRRNIDYQNAEKVWRNDGYNVRYSRKYSVEAFFKRIVSNLNNLKLTIYYIENEKEIDAACYLKFAAVFEKK